MACCNPECNGWQCVQYIIRRFGNLTEEQLWAMTMQDVADWFNENSPKISERYQFKFSCEQIQEWIAEEAGSEAC